MPRIVAFIGLLALAACQLETTSGEAPDEAWARARLSELDARHRFAGRELSPLSSHASDRALAASSLPARADQALVVRDQRSGMEIAVSLEGAAPTPGVRAGEWMLYPSAGPDGGDVIQRASGAGVEDLLILKAPADVRYLVDVSAVAGLRAVGGSAEMLDARGTPRLRVRRPWLLDARGEVVDAAITIVDCAFDADPAPPWNRRVTAPGRDMCTFAVTWSDHDVTYPVMIDPQWVSAADMDANRYRHTATVFDPGDGELVIVAGGFRVDTAQARNSVEIYHPDSDTWAQGQSMLLPRGGHSATLATVSLGPILVFAGGQQVAGQPSSIVAVFERLRLTDFDYMSALFCSGSGRADHRAVALTVLNQQRVLLTGGYSAFGETNESRLLEIEGACDLFPWTSAPFAPSHQRSGHAVVEIASGELLLVGGCSLTDPTCTAWERYCPASVCAPASGNQIAKLSGHTATKLVTGKVLVAGGLREVIVDGSTQLELSADVWEFNATGNLWSGVTDLAAPRFNHSATLLASGEVLVAGGIEAGAAAAQALRYGPGIPAWKPAGELRVARSQHQASPLSSGRVLLSGGLEALDASAELFVPCASDSDCPDPTTQYCSADTTACANKDQDGASCSDDGTCLHSACVEGVCCDTTCEDVCKSCTLPGLVGSCAALEDPPLSLGCVPIDYCLEDGITYVDELLQESDCTPYRCIGRCLQSCNASSECAPGYVCDGDHQCVSPPPASGGQAPCGHAPTPKGGAPWWLVAALCGLCVGVRRRSDRQNSSRALTSGTKTTSVPLSAVGAPGPRN